MTEPARVLPTDTVLLPDLLALTADAADAVQTLLAQARARVAARVSTGGRISNAALEADQTAAHGLAWLATYAEALRQLRAWAGRLDEQGAFGETEALILQIGFGEYLAQIDGGIPMSQNEMARPRDVGLAAARTGRAADPGGRGPDRRAPRTRPAPASSRGCLTPARPPASARPASTTNTT